MTNFFFNVDKDMRLQNLDLVTNTWIFWNQ